MIPSLFPDFSDELFVNKVSRSTMNEAQCLCKDVCAAFHGPALLHSQEAVRRGSLDVFHAGWNAHADSSVHAAMSYLCDCKKRGIRKLSWKRARNCHAAAGRLQAKTSIHFALMARTWTANKNSCFALGVFVDSHMDSSRSRAQLQKNIDHWHIVAHIRTQLHYLEGVAECSHERRVMCTS